MTCIKPSKIFIPSNSPLRHEIYIYRYVCIYLQFQPSPKADTITHETITPAEFVHSASLTRAVNRDRNKEGRSK
jgi:hypothetical protein